MVMFVLGTLILLLSAILSAILIVDDAMYGFGPVMFVPLGILLIIMGAMEDCKNETMIEHNINPVVIEYITDVRNQKDETNISTSDAIAVYIECRRNGLSEEEIMLFLLPDITEDEAKSIVKTYNLLEEEN